MLPALPRHLRSVQKCTWTTNDVGGMAATASVVQLVKSVNVIILMHLSLRATDTDSVYTLLRSVFSYLLFRNSCGLHFY